MSSFKKLRLDPDTPVAGTSKNLLNQPGANDSSGGSGRGSYVDNSSFSSSTSGGSGTCMRSAGPFRTRYSQPLRISSPSSGGFSRFAPYYFGRERRSTLRVPLIRARRDESDSESNRPSSRASLNSSIGGDSTSSASAPVTTSTAQRIIETLQKLSTPVMNAGKIRIDQDIKAVQPLPFGSGTQLSLSSRYSPINRSSGPPKMCSSLLLTNPSSANQVSPTQYNSSFGDQRRLFTIPKMVDATTNTEKETESISISPAQLQKSSPRMKSLDYRPMSSKPFSPSVETSSGLSENCSTAKPLTTKSPTINSSPANSTAKSPTVKPLLKEVEEDNHVASEYNFSSSGWAPEVFESYFSNANKVEKAGEKRKIENQASREESSSSFKPFSFSSSTDKDISGIKPALKRRFDDNVDAVKNNDKSADSPEKSAVPTPTLQSKPESKKWRCTGCWVDNEPDYTECVCCSAANPKSVGSVVPKTQSVVAKNPTVGSASADKNKKWTCPTCMVPNEAIASACVCCNEKNPNAPAPSASSEVSKTQGVSTPAPTFKFGLPSSGINSNSPSLASTTSAPGKFSFGVSTSSETSKPIQDGFKFGAPALAAPISTTGIMTGKPNALPAPVITTIGITSTPPSLSSTIITTSSISSGPTGVSNTPFLSNAPMSICSAPSPSPSLQVPSQSANTPPAFKFGIQMPPASTTTASSAFGGAGIFGSSTTTIAPSPSINKSAPVTTTTASSNIFGGLKPSNEVSGPVVPALAPVVPASPAPIFGSTNFQSVASPPQPTFSPSFNFGATPSSNGPLPKPESSNFCFGALAGAGANNTFTFGRSNQQQPPAQSTFQPPLSLTATHGSGNPTQPAPNPDPQQNSLPLFAVNQPPAWNFDQFNNTNTPPPNDSHSPGPGRVIKKAVRRLNKN